MKKYYGLMLFLAMICSCMDTVNTGLNAQKQFRTFTISGKIINDNQGIGDAKITLSGLNSFFELSDYSGNYKIVGVPQDTYTVSVYKNGWIITPDSMELTIDQDIENLDFTGNQIFYSQLQSIQSDSPQAGEFFGSTLAICGDYIAAGSPQDIVGANPTGAVYVYRRVSESTWSSPRIMSETVFTTGSKFGDAVALTNYNSRYYIIIGAPGYDSAKGAVHVYMRDQDDVDKWNGNLWKIKNTITDPTEGAAVTLQDNDRFGAYLAASSKYFAVSAPGSNSNRGLVYVFNRVNTNEWKNADGPTDTKKQLIPPDVVAGDDYGTALAMDGDFVIVGAKSKNGLYQKEGAAYIFYQSAENVWSEDYVKLVSPNPELNDFFGTSVAIFNDYAAVGAPLKNAKDNTGAGVVYIFKKIGATGWGAVAEITAPTSAANEEFGRSVALNSGYLLVGATGSNESAGSVYVFGKDSITGSWTYIRRLYLADGQQFDYYGNSIAIDENNAVVGSYKRDVNGIINAGQAYIY